MKTILIVADVLDLAQLFADILTDHGYGAVTASTGTAALHLIANGNQRVDLLVTDTLLGDMDAITLMQGLRARQPAVNVPVIVVAASRDYGRRAQETGAAAVLLRPYTPEQVLAAVHQCLA